jgi:Cu+-exporting ATPase
MSESAILSFKVDGLSCGSCAAHAEKALRGVPGVQEASVNLANHTALIHVANGHIAPQISAALRDAGKPAKPNQFELDLSGMHCGSCVGRAERALEQVAGVLEANVNLASGRARVITLGSDPSALTAALMATGLEAQLHEDSSHAQDEHAVQATALGREALFAAALTLPVFILEMGGHIVPAFHHMIAQTIGTQQS